MSFGSWRESIKDGRQGIYVGATFFNIYLNDLFYIADFTEVCKFTDDATMIL